MWRPITKSVESITPAKTPLYSIYITVRIIFVLLPGFRFFFIFFPSFVVDNFIYIFFFSYIKLNERAWKFQKKKKNRKMRILCKCQLIKKKAKFIHIIQLNCVWRMTYIYAEKLMRLQRYLYKKRTGHCAGNASECGL